MKSVLNALQEGRLIELPENDKEKSLQYLATLIEAIPDFRSGLDFAGTVLAREKTTNTAIGLGWACPHGRVAGDGELLCALGWSPAGIDYGAPDGKPVHFLIMHCIPDSQKNAYLREISTVARAIQKNPALGELSLATELGDVRHRLIDLLTDALESAVPDAKARMIQLSARQAVAAAMDAALPADALAALNLVPLSILIAPGSRPIVLSQDREAVLALESDPDLTAPLSARVPFDRAGYTVVMRSVAPYQPDRMLYDCLAVKKPVPRPKGQP
jgi:nitrogen PTS system EIIA component